MNLLVSLSALFIAWFLVLTIPGPNFVLVTQHSMSDSRQSGIQIAVGVSVGAATWATASLIGISQIFDNSIWLYNMIRIVGGCYLAYMGLNFIVNSMKEVVETESVQELQVSFNRYSAIKLGMITSYSNPKTAIFFGSLFVMTFPVEAPIWFYIVTVTMIFSASVIWYSIVAYIFSMHRVQMGYKRTRKVVDKISGIIFILLGARLVLSRS